MQVPIIALPPGQKAGSFQLAWPDPALILLLLLQSCLLYPKQLLVIAQQEHSRQHYCPLCPKLLLQQQSPKQQLSEDQLEHSILFVILTAPVPSSAAAFAVEGEVTEGIVTMLVHPSKVHHEYHQNQILPVIVSTIEAAGTIESIAASDHFQATTVVVTAVIQQVIVGVPAIAGIGRGAIVILLSIPLRYFISSTARAIAAISNIVAILIDERMPQPAAEVS